MASVRELAYKDRFIWSLQQAVSAFFDDCNGFDERFVFPDLTTRVPLVLTINQTEWTTLYSAILTGADLAYPFQTAEVEALFLATVNCPLNVFCNALIDCLENDPDTLAALLKLLSDNGVTGGVGDPITPLDSSILSDNLLPAGYVCTDDKAFGMALAIVNSINESTTEVLQAFELLTNPLEIAAELADNVPGIGAIASAGDVVNWIQDTATEAYVAAWSTSIRDELACLLWCAFKDGCELSYDLIFNVYLEQAEVTPPTGNTLEEWLAWLLELPLAVDLITVSSVSLLGLLAIKYGGSFGEFALGIRSLETVIELAEDDSSGDWAILCDPCVGWCFTWDLTVSQTDWTIIAGELTANGIQDTFYTQAGTDQHGSNLEMDMTGMNVTEVQFTGTHILKEYFTPGWNQAFVFQSAVGNLLSVGKADGADIPFAYVIAGLTGVTGIVQVGLRDGIMVTGSGNDILSTDGFIATVTLKGTGLNPFGSNNCSP